MGYVFDFHDARDWTQLTTDTHQQAVMESQQRLMLEMLEPSRGQSVLGIGCGTGQGLLPFLELGVEVTGIDPSAPMLDIARRNLGRRADLHRGCAEDLPFEDNAFNFACLVASLEFVEDPCQALREAARVTRDKLFIAVFNRYALKAIERRVRGIFTRTLYNKARFFSIWELKRELHTLLGPVPVRWSCPSVRSAGTAGRSIFNRGADLMSWLPFGTMVSMVVVLVPRFRTRPMELRYRPKRTPGTVAGQGVCRGQFLDAASAEGFQLSSCDTLSETPSIPAAASQLCLRSRS